MQYSKIVGGNGQRHERDFYPTPIECTQALLNFLKEKNVKINKVWECACGELHMSNIIEQNGIDVISTDILTGTDFITAEVPDNNIDWIITNPPFNVAEKFIERAFSLNLPFAFLLKSQFWHSKKRYPLFEKTKPSYVLPLTWRPDFTGQGSSLLDMAWVVWGLNTKETIYQPLQKPTNSEQLNYYKQLSCPKCGGILSEIREHNNKEYRHCYGCHFEFFIGDKINE